MRGEYSCPENFKRAMNRISKMVSENDKQFLEQFEKLQIAPESFTHKEHIRLAWIYLQLFSFSEAISKICSGIKIFDKQLGDGTKYHETVTRAYAHIISKRIKNFRTSNWNEFINENTDLLTNYKDALLKHYSSGILFSEKAKKRFIKPDKIQL